MQSAQTPQSPGNIFKAIILVLVISLALVIGYSIGRKEKITTSVSPANIDNVRFTGTTPPPEIAKEIDFSQFWDVWVRVSKTYIDKSAVNPQKMVFGAISGMVASLDDPYTVFLPPKENKDAKDELGGQFEGIGAQLGVKNKRIVVIAPLKDTPAERSGIRPGDWIVKVDGKETLNWTLPETVAKIRGPKGTKVMLTILHDNEDKTIDIALAREAIHVASVEWKKVNFDCARENKTCTQVNESCSNCVAFAHLKLNRFGDNTAGEWAKAVKEILEAQKAGSVKGIIFDLRNNPGGYLQGAIHIASEFFTDGTIVTQQNYDGTKNVYDVTRRGVLINEPVVVLVNKGSASASEIVAGALKVRKRARLVGQTTFGKGSVQDTQDLPNGAGLHITVAKWLLPDGSWINGTGVNPDVVVEMDEKNPEKDPQLEKAGELLLQ